MRGPLTFDKFCVAFTEERKQPYTSLRRYRCLGSHLEAALGRPATVDDFTTETLEKLTAHLDQLCRDAGQLAKTAKNYCVIFRQLWREAARRNQCESEPPARERRDIKGQVELVEATPVGPPPQAKPDVTMTLFDYFRLYYRRRRLLTAKLTTIRRYVLIFDQFSRFLGYPATLADLTDDTVLTFLSACYLSKNRSPATANAARNHLLAMWRYAAGKRHVEMGPDVLPVPGYRYEPTAWTPEEMGKILDSCRLPLVRRQNIGGVPWSQWWTALILTLYYSGQRSGAVLQARVDEFDAATGVLFIPAERQKHRRDFRRRLSPVAIEAIRAALKSCPDRELLFPWDRDKVVLFTDFRKILVAAGLPHGRRDGLHKIRRTAGTHAEITCGPGSAMDLLQHTNPNVTERYLDRSQFPDSQISDRLPEPTTDFTPPPEESRLLNSVLNEYLGHRMEASKNHKLASQTVSIVFGGIRDCGFKRVSDLDADVYLTYLDRKYASGLAANTCYGRLSHMRSFAEWLVRDLRFKGAAESFYAKLVAANRSRQWREAVA